MSYLKLLLLSLLMFAGLVGFDRPGPLPAQSPEVFESPAYIPVELEA